MTATKVPAEPLLVVLGSTGTGKSDLAVELAVRFQGEIINSDAMQLYNGLPIITNKIAQSEQKGITHHLLGHIPLSEAPWDVEDYKREASKVIREIRARGNLPILVGGTQYYTDPLLFTDVILDDVEQQKDSSNSFPILDESTEVLLEELRRCDPVMAERWHPNDRRKISRSLEIFLHTGKPASELYAEQERRRKDAGRGKKSARPWEKLLLWVHSDREILCERLNRRVDKMRDDGLLNEVRELYDMKTSMESSGKAMDLSKGIFQSIGYRQFEPYMQAIDAGRDLETLKRLELAGLEDMKAATRRYANYQTKWIRLKQMRRLRDEGPEAVSSLYLIDSTDISKFDDNVVQPAVRLTEQFLCGQARLLPMEMSQKAGLILSGVIEPPPKETPLKTTCHLCNTVLVTAEAWSRHVKSTGHKKALKKKARLALIAENDGLRPTEMSGGGADVNTDKSGASRSSSPGLESMFPSS